MTPEEHAEMDRIFNCSREEQDRRNTAAEAAWAEQQRVARECAEALRNRERDQ